MKGFVFPFRGGQTLNPTLGLPLLLSFLASLASAQTVRPCAACHPAQAKPHPATSMAHAMELPGDCAILKAHPVLNFQEGGYSYRIERQGGQSLYTVTNGAQTMTVPLGWAFGLGLAGQTYVFEKDGTLYESRVSYYREMDGLDLTMGAANLKPSNLLEAAGRSIGRAEAVRCFGCHSTNAVSGNAVALPTLIPGVQCERCHGDTAHHPATPMKSLRSMTSEDTSTFCGQCHRTWDEIAGSGTLGIANIRFQPYRLTGSKCYDAEDRRIRCTACHDVHNELNTHDIDYDAKCKACHAGGKVTARICKVAAGNCVSCHMPKLPMPGSHHKFTDHEIRIVRANAPYPN